MKPTSDFHKHSRCAGGYNSVCKICRKPLSKKQYSNTSLEYRIWHRAKIRAKTEGIPFDIEIKDILIPEVCPVFGTKFVIGDNSLTASIDKLIPELGYTKGNIYIISNRANRLKNDATLVELLDIIKYIRERINNANNLL